MRIIGRGLLAQAFEARAKSSGAPDAVIFATGVSDSSTADSAAYARETRILDEAIEDAARSGRTLVYFSSGGTVYGDHSGVRDEATPLAPASAYARHKVTCEGRVAESDASHLIVRLPNLVGANASAAQLVPGLARQLRAGHARVLEAATRDLLDVDDAADLVMRLLDAGARDDVFVVASGESVPVLDIVLELQQILGTSARIERVAGGTPQRFSIAKLKRILPDVHFEPRDYSRVLRKYAGVLRHDRA